MTKEQKRLYLQGEDRERKLAERFENTGKIIPFEEPIREGQWYRKIVPGAVCADGSEYPILFNSGKENCLVTKRWPGVQIPLGMPISGNRPVMRLILDDILSIPVLIMSTEAGEL